MIGGTSQSRETVMVLVTAIHDPKTIVNVVESEHGSNEDRFPQILNNTTFDVAR